MKFFKIKVFAFILFIFLISPSDVFAKDYSITDAQISVRINPDGSADISEKRTYDFDDQFSWADEWINLVPKCVGCQNYTIRNAVVSDDTTKKILPTEIQNTPDKFYIKWHYTANNEIKTFLLNYKIENAVTNHNDISEFYWQLIGDGWDKGVGNVDTKIYISPPAPDNKIWAFGHGPLNGKIYIQSGSQVNFSAENLPAKKFFEVRVLFPKLETAIFAQNGNSNLNKILAEEKTFEKKSVFNKYMAWLFVIVLSILPIIRVIYWVKKWRQVGDDAPLPEVNIAGKLHEAPTDLEPALVETLINSTLLIPTGKSVTATILNLVHKKILKIERFKTKGIFGKTDYTLILINKNKKLTYFENELVQFLFGDKGNEISFSEIKKIGRKYPTKTNTFWKKWQEEPLKELLDKGYIEKESKLAKDKLMIEVLIYFFVIILLTIFGAPMFSVFGIYIIIPILIAISAFVFLLILSPYMIKRTEKGNYELASWLAFKSYLKDYKVTVNYPIDSVILWEKYLVYGTALGISAKALSELPINLAITNTSNIYVMTSGGSNNFSTFSSGLTSMTSTFSSFGATGSGSSGGFSGGGGGGGGGGAG